MQTAMVTCLLRLGTSARCLCRGPHLDLESEPVRTRFTHRDGLREALALRSRHFPSFAQKRAWSKKHFRKEKRQEPHLWLVDSYQ